MADKTTAHAMLKTSRRRLVGSLMGYLEQNVYPSLSEPERERLRNKVLASVDGYHDFALDLVTVYADEQAAAVNEEFLALLEQIHRAVVGRG